MLLFIPKKICVGFQKREDTSTGKLAYVVYYDQKGVLRKEKSWSHWRDKNIQPKEFLNEPIEGLTLNREARRCNWSHFSSNRSYIRVYDPRGIEFEISPGNLIEVLKESDCLKRVLTGKFVYAWAGTELVILPCISENYKKGLEHTARQSGKVSIRDLFPGCSCTTKKGETLVYMGRLLWYKWKWNKPRIGKKNHIFWDGTDFKDISSTRSLSCINGNKQVANYADLLCKFKLDIRSEKFVGIKTTQVSVDLSKIAHGSWLGACTLPFYVREKDYIVSIFARKSIIGDDNSFALIKSFKLSTDSFTPSHFSNGPWVDKSFQMNKKTITNFLKDAVEVTMVTESGREFVLENSLKYYTF